MLLFKHNLNQHRIVSEHDRENLMLFSPWCYGHYPSYLRYLVEYQQSRMAESSRLHLEIVVAPDFLQVHREIVELVQENCGNICFRAIAPAEAEKLYTARSGWEAAFVQYELITQYARQLNATEVLMMYFDSCQIPLVLGRKLPCAFSGIYFRPTFHYPKITMYRFSWKEQIQALRERLFLFRLHQHPQLKTLFCLDPFAVEAMHPQPHKLVYLPDPVAASHPLLEDLDRQRTQLGIEPHRQVFLSFGRLADDRKGVAQLMEAVTFLPPELCQRLCLLFVGETDPNGIKRLAARFAEIQRSHPIQIVTCYGHVPESQVGTYFHLADAVLAPYQKHVGMSGILLQAAAAQKPVLSSDYGLMGAMIARYRLGIAVDTTDTHAIAAGLMQLLHQGEIVGDRQTMKAFAEENSAERFASVIFRSM